MSTKDNGFLGNLFDLDGDGKTDAAEEALMFMLFNELEETDKEDNENRETDLDDLDIEGI